MTTLRLDMPPKFEFRTDCESCRGLQESLALTNACLERAVSSHDVSDAKATKIAYDVTFERIGRHMQEAHPTN